MSKADQAEAAVRAVLAAHQRIDALVNNAGITRDNLLIRMKPEEWEPVLATNLTGVFHCTQVALRPMLKQKQGRIVNITSVVGLAGNGGQANYAASKAGIIGFTKSVAREVASRSITVNAVAPGFVETEMTEAMTELTDIVPPATLAQIEYFRKLGLQERTLGLVVMVVNLTGCAGI